MSGVVVKEPEEASRLAAEETRSLPSSRGHQWRPQFSRWLPYLVVAVPAAAFCLWYVQKGFVDVIILDGFIHVPYIGDALDSGGTFADVVKAPFAGEHFLLGYRLMLFVNAKLFGLDMRMDPLMFILAFAATAAILHAESARVFSQFRPSVRLIVFIPIGLLAFSLVAPPMLLMSTQFVCSTAVGLAIAWLVQRDLVEGDSASSFLRRPLTRALVLIPVYFMLSGAYFAGLVLGLLSMYFFRRLLERTAWLERRFVMVAAVLVPCIAVYTFFMLRALASPDSSNPRAFTLPLTKLWGLLLSHLAGIGAGLIDSHTIETTSSTVVLSAGIIGALIIAFSLWLFVKTRMYRKTYLPVFCIFYSFGIVTMVFAGRSGKFGWRWITAEWYAFHLRFSIIGAVWIILFALADHMRKANEEEGASRWRSWILPAGALSLLFIGGCQVVGNMAQWARAPHLKQYYEQKRLALLYPELVEDPTIVLLWPEPLLGQSRAVLEKYSLSSFSRESRSEVERRLAEEPLRNSDWHDDGWVGREGAMVFATKMPKSLKLRVEGPQFIPANLCEFRLNHDLFFSGTIAGGTAKELSAPLPRGTNVLTVSCQQSLSPSAIGQGSDSRVLAVRVSFPAS
ncbi:MAG TPA: hypothetical protein VM142_14410 [Acidimicrobiales bacterium]|nr:hypothetical protein [Acidimicrobiales bacterium]